MVGVIEDRARQADQVNGGVALVFKKAFTESMDNDLDLQGAFDGLYGLLSRTGVSDLTPGEAAGVTKTLREIDEVLRVIFDNNRSQEPG